MRPGGWGWVGDRSRGRFATPADPLPRSVARTEGYTYAAYAAKVWDLSIVQGPVSVAPCQSVRFATFASLYDPVARHSAGAAAPSNHARCCTRLCLHSAQSNVPNGRLPLAAARGSEQRFQGSTGERDRGG
jgi:hypothetical protein